jgi:hypothetical protein
VLAGIELAVAVALPLRVLRIQSGRWCDAALENQYTEGPLVAVAGLTGDLAVACEFDALRPEADQALGLNGGEEFFPTYRGGQLLHHAMREEPRSRYRGLYLSRATRGIV